MGTAETFIVFSALIALIALVAIGIDWIGKPLKHRRFIPRLYRFEDEKLPIDEFGNPTLGHESPLPQVHAPPAYNVPTVAAPSALPMHQPAPIVVARVPAPASVSAPAGANSGSAFSDNLASGESPGHATEQIERIGAGGFDSWLDTGSERAVEAPSGGPWQPGMALDATVDDRKPNLATKAERFWMSTAALLESSHFDDDDVMRMASGKAPRRKNPRSGRIEAMQLTGLRQASRPSDVSMRWPGESVDPWNAT